MISKEFTIPKTAKFEGASGENYAHIVVEPFERGYGTTVGNALRRVLLASLEGSAVTAIRFEDIHHEFAAIPGVYEDVTDVVLNLKKCQIRLNNKESVIFTFKHEGEGPVTVAKLFAGQDIDVFNPDHVVFTATSKTTKVQMEIKVAKGRGYVTADQFELEHAPLGTIYLDASFSPVTKVNFQIEDARVGQMTDFDRLVFDVWTNGSITPQDALTEASALLISHFNIFLQEDREGPASGGDLEGESSELMQLLNKPISEVELSVRSANCLKSAGIGTLGQLVARTENELLSFHNFGKQSLKEIQSKLEELGLSLGMNVGAAGTMGAPIPVDPVEELYNIDDDVDSDDSDDLDEE